MHPDRIDTEDALDTVFGAPRFLLFKHSNRCGVSARAFREVEGFLAGGAGVPVGYIDVVADRALSERVAEVTGVPHESPQALLLENGKVVWHTSHFKITRDALREAVA